MSSGKKSADRTILPEGVNEDRLRCLIDLARDEDWGTCGDLTSALLDRDQARAPGSWQVSSRAPGCLCGAALIPYLLDRLAPDVRADAIALDGDELSEGTVIAALTGPLAPMLSAERTMLNLLQRLSGIATLTRRYVRAVAASRARILDTRKTTPGLRDLERYAVRTGGGFNHRNGLFDAVLIKDNHLAGVPVGRLAFHVFEMLNRIPTLAATPRFVEVEVDSLDQYREILKIVGVSIILLDNFSIADLNLAVQLRERAGLADRIELEASGGVSLANVAEVAATGVDRIAIGALTHSAVALDIGLDAAP